MSYLVYKNWATTLFNLWLSKNMHTTLVRHSYFMCVTRFSIDDSIFSPAFGYQVTSFFAASCRSISMKSSMDNPNSASHIRRSHHHAKHPPAKSKDRCDLVDCPETLRSEATRPAPPASPDFGILCIRVVDRDWRLIGGDDTFRWCPWLLSLRTGVALR